MRISVIIPHLNQPELLARCIGSLFAMTRKPDETIVVDNGSTELPTQICANHGVQLLAEIEPGPGPARNRGVKASTGDVLAFIDADCLADPGWLAAAEAALADASAMILGGDVRIALADPDRVTMLEAYESVFAYRMDRYIAREGFTGTGNLVVRRPVLESVGPFAGIGVAEDRDWGRRATGQGYSIRYIPDMKVYHPARKNFSDLSLKWQRQSAHDYAEAKSRMGFLLKALAMPLSPLMDLPQILMTDRLTRASDRFRAFGCLVRVRLLRMWLMAGLLLGNDPERGARTWNRR